MSKIVLPAPTIVLTGTQYTSKGVSLGMQTVNVDGSTSKYVPINSDTTGKEFDAVQKLYFGPDLKVSFQLPAIPADTEFFGDADYVLRTASGAVIPPNATVFYGDLAGIMNDSDQAKKAEVRYSICGKDSSRSKFYRWRSQLDGVAGLKMNKTGADNTYLKAKTHFKGAVSLVSEVQLFIVNQPLNTFDNVNDIGTQI